jgi:hypothetical protein
MQIGVNPTASTVGAPWPSPERKPGRARSGPLASQSRQRLLDPTADPATLLRLARALVGQAPTGVLEEPHRNKRR